MHTSATNVRWLTNAIRFEGLQNDYMATCERISPLWSKNFQINVRRLHYLHDMPCRPCRAVWTLAYLAYLAYLHDMKITDWTDHQSRQRSLDEQQSYQWQAQDQPHSWIRHSGGGTINWDVNLMEHVSKTQKLKDSKLQGHQTKNGLGLRRLFSQ